MWETDEGEGSEDCIEGEWNGCALIGECVCKAKEAPFVHIRAKGVQKFHS